MSHKPGTNLGGVRDLESLRKRCFIEPETNCWRWRLAMKEGAAKTWVVLADGTRRHMVGRRAALLLKSGEDVPEGRVVFALACCPNKDCVNPSHCRTGTRKEASAAAFARGDFDTEARRRATEVALRAHRKLSPEQHRVIATSDLPSPQIAKLLGVSSGRVNAIKRGEFGARNNSIFNYQP